jgi:chorismate-pyruvate lyase
MQRATRLQRDAVQPAADLAAPWGSPALDAFLKRAIRVTDGTVTNLIEEFVEAVVIEKLAETSHRYGDDVAGRAAWPDLAGGEPVVHRTVLIRGRDSGRVFLHAESWIAVDRLDDILRRQLRETDRPIGKLIRDHRRETYRELLGDWHEPAGELAALLGCAPGQTLVARLYRIFLEGRAAIQIVERFPGTPGAVRGDDGAEEGR